MTTCLSVTHIRTWVTLTGLIRSCSEPAPSAVLILPLWPYGLSTWQEGGHVPSEHWRREEGTKSSTMRPGRQAAGHETVLQKESNPCVLRACTGRGVHQHLQPLPESDHGPPPPFRASIIGPVPKEPGISWLMTCHTDGVIMKCLEWLIPT